MNKIELLIGPIASGKSTYAKKRAKEGAIISNDDSIVNALHANEYSLYDKRLKPLYKAIELNIVTSAIMIGRDVVIDRTCSERDTRQRYISLAKSLNVPIHGIIFTKESPEIHAQRRFDSDNRGLSYEKWLEIAKFHDSRYEPPTVDEGFDYLIYFDTSVYFK